MRKLERAAQGDAPADLVRPGDADITLVGWGSTYGALREATDLLNAQGHPTNLLQFVDMFPLDEDRISAELDKIRRDDRGRAELHRPACPRPARPDRPEGRPEDQQVRRTADLAATRSCDGASGAGGGAVSDLKIFNGGQKSTWCPGCGDFGILAALKQALAGLDLHPHEVMLVSGIGCGSKLPHYMKANGYNSIHGRALPVAQGIKLANHALKVIAVTGDGDGYGIGQGHFIHAMRRNADITHVVENNQVYGLTKGQYSPTSERGYISTFSPEGAHRVRDQPDRSGALRPARRSSRGPRRPTRST